MPAFVQHFAVDDVLLNALCYLIASVGDWGRGEQRGLAPLGNRQSLYSWESSLARWVGATVKVILL